MFEQTVTVELMTELDLHKGAAVNEEPFFTGWKDTGLSVCFEETKPTGEFVGQLVQYMLPERMGAYVNLPGFETGVFPPGSTFNIGTERLRDPITVEQMRVMLVAGLEKLKETVQKYRREHAQ